MILSGPSPAKKYQVASRLHIYQVQRRLLALFFIINNDVNATRAVFGRCP